MTKSAIMNLLPTIHAKRLIPGAGIFFTFLIIVLSCTERKGNSKAEAAAADSLKENRKDNRERNEKRQFNYDRYTEKKHFDLKNYYANIQTGYYFLDSVRDPGTMYPENNLLIIRNKNSNKSDTLVLETSDDLDGVEITDWSDSLHFKLCLEIEWSGDSDVPMSEFIGYANDSLKTFFTIEYLRSIRRKDEWTLAGFVGSRDEVVENFQFDYPFIISLKNYSIVVEDPAVQYIGYSTKAIETIKGYRMVSPKDSIRYTIRKGTELRVDTFYRKAGRVRLVISDSIIVHTDLKTAQENLGHNSAG